MVWYGLNKWKFITVSVELVSGTTGLWLVSTVHWVHTIDVVVEVLT